MKVQLIDFLTRLNADEDGKLLSVNIPEYVNKIQENATILTIVKNNVISALIAFYENDKKKELVFLTMIGVEKESRGLGYSKLLLEASFRDVERKGFKKYALEVNQSNKKAINLYEKFGFKLVSLKSGIIYMEKNL